jgi:hypothetical protein
MNQRVIAVSLLLAAQALCARDDATVDLYAGWSWMPFGYYYDAPYRYGGRYPYWHPWPYAGVMVPLDGDGGPLRGPLYGYTGYAPSYWGFEHGVRLRLNDAEKFPAPADPLLPPLPGSAPLDLRDPRREEAWAQEIDSFLGSLGSPEWFPSAAATNAPPQKRQHETLSTSHEK